MRFNVRRLLATIDQEIANREERAETVFQQAVAEYEQAKADWLASDHPEALRDCARKIVDKVRKGRVVTPDDVEPIVNNRYRSESHLFFNVEPKRETNTRKPNVERLRDLQAFLLTVSDEEVSASGLRDVGFRDIAGILRASR